MRLFISDQDLEREIAERVNTAVAEALLRSSEGEKRSRAELEQFHAWEVRRLTARAEDAETAMGRYKGGYKRALSKLGKLRGELAEAKMQLLKGGITAELDDKGRPKQTPAQEIMDEVASLIPALDELSSKQVRTYVDRELRMRGIDEKDAILQEVIDGGYQD